MFTTEYKGFLIYHCDEYPRCSIWRTVGGFVGQFRSMHAAKCWITTQWKATP